MNDCKILKKLKNKTLACPNLPKNHPATDIVSP